MLICYGQNITLLWIKSKFGIAYSSKAFSLWASISASVGVCKSTYADFAGNINNKKCITCYVFILGNIVIIWVSQLQFLFFFILCLQLK